MKDTSVIKSINPYTKEVIEEYTPFTDKIVEEKLEIAHTAYKDWKSTSFDERKEILYKVASLLEKRAEEYATLISNEMGKPITQAISEVKKCATVCRYYADNAEKFLSIKPIKTEAYKSYVHYEPQGIILGVMPWNFPFWQVFRFSAPAIMAGNVCVLKHASNVFGCALAIEQVFKDANLPNGVFTSLLIPSKTVEFVIASPYVTGVILTGSAEAGSKVASQAGENLKKSVLELGGSNALIALEDCDIAASVEACIQGRYLNTGQSCIAGKRLLVHKNIAEDFTSKLLEQVRELKSGNPLDKATFIGVMAREDLAEKLEKQVNKSLDMGAEVIIGGKRDGAFYSPTVLTNVSLDMPVCKEEVFGPVLPIIQFETLDEAIEISNATNFGLGVSIFTKDTAFIEKHVHRFEEGCVFVNDFVKSDPSLPFGGIKRSGYGRELSKDGIMEFVNKKTIFIK